MNKLYSILLLTLLSININAQSVGIKNSEEDPNIPYHFPANSASLDTYFTQRGVLIPQYDLQELNNPASPVDFTQDIAEGKFVDGTIIFNYGSKYNKGYYVWVKDTWHLVLYKGIEPQQMTIKVPSKTIILDSQTRTNNRVINGWTTVANNITDAEVNDNSITLPAGKYAYKYTVDPVTLSSAEGGDGPKAYFGAFDTYSMSTFLQKKDGTPITETQYSTVLNSGTARQGQFLFYQGLFIFELTEPTTIQQTFQYGDGTTNYNGAIVRTEFNAIISSVSN